MSTEATTHIHPKLGETAEVVDDNNAYRLRITTASVNGRYTLIVTHPTTATVQLLTKAPQKS